MSAIPSSAAIPAATARALRVVAVLGLAVAGAIHLALAPGHIALSPALAIAFLAAGSIQVALAIALLRQHHHRVLTVAAVTSALFIAAFIYDSTVGLPMVSHTALHDDTHSHSHGEEASTHHAAQPFDPAPLVAKSAEMATLVSAGLLLGVSRRRTRLAVSSPRVLA